jgi:hypothetical protein
MQGPFLLAQKYVLVVASANKAAAHCTEEHARAWLEAGASYVCAWGPTAGVIEETFDYASFLPELSQPLPFTLMTTSHEEGTLEEVLWFAFYNATSPEESPVIAIVHPQFTLPFVR